MQIITGGELINILGFINEINFDFGANSNVEISIATNKNELPIIFSCLSAQQLIQVPMFMEILQKV